jgi:hypothetical protein
LPITARLIENYCQNFDKNIMNHPVDDSGKKGSKTSAQKVCEPRAKKVMSSVKQ